MAYKGTKKKIDGPKQICQNSDCIHMGKYQSADRFYNSNNPALPHHPFCKDCVNAMINIEDMETVYDVLKVLDMPFIIDIWNEVLLKNDKNYIGAYLKIINFNRRQTYKDYRWRDSVFELPDDFDKLISPETQDIIDGLATWNDEWQGEFTKEEITFLNDYYNKLKDSFTITNVNHEDYARKIAKASLAMDKYFVQMMKGIPKSEAKYKVAKESFDTLSKSAQFTESQRSANDVNLDNFGVVFDKVEKHEWIPEYIPTPEEEDIYDKLLRQFSNIEKSL